MPPHVAPHDRPLDPRHGRRHPAGMEPHPNRRTFLAASAFVAASLPSLTPAFAAEPSPKKFRAAVIGHTGRGNYGHGMDVLFTGRDDCEVVAVADPVEAG